MVAAVKGKTRLVKMLLSYGAATDKRSLSGGTALMLAVINDHEGVADILIEHGAALHFQYEDGETALMLAAHRGNEWLVEKMMNSNEKASLLKQKNKNGNNALDYACLQDERPIINLLLHHGAEIRAPYKGVCASFLNEKKKESDSLKAKRQKEKDEEEKKQRWLEKKRLEKRRLEKKERERKREEKKMKSEEEEEADDQEDWGWEF